VSSSTNFTDWETAVAAVILDFRRPLSGGTTPESRGRGSDGTLSGTKIADRPSRQLAHGTGCLDRCPEQLAVRLKRAHTLCDDYGDVASASLIENWIDEAEHRVWFLYEATGHDCEKQE
jgi:hypothetical protein